MRHHYSLVAVDCLGSVPARSKVSEEIPLEAMEFDSLEDAYAELLRRLDEAECSCEPLELQRGAQA